MIKKVFAMNTEQTPDRDYNISDLYNSQIKDEFLKAQYDDLDTRRSVYYEFKSIAKKERELNKDVFAFNNSELRSLVQTIDRTSVSALSKTLSILNTYVNWAILNGKRGKYENGINFVQGFTLAQKDLRKYVSNRKMYLSILDKVELENFLNLLVNPMDRALILCFYNFVGGDKMYEVRSLTASAINVENNTLILQTDEDDPSKTRVQPVSQRLINELIMASKVDKYYRDDGEDWEIGKSSVPYLELIDNDYIFRPIKRREDYSEGMFSLSGFTNKIKNIKEEADLEYVTPTSLRDTRIIHEISDETKSRGLSYPDRDVYNTVRNRLKEKHNHNLSPMQFYSIRQKAQQILEIKGSLLS